MKTLSYIAVLQILFVKFSIAQDYHFSQFDANPFYINPALTGERLGDYKGIQVNADYRDQMAKYTKSSGAYQSVAAGIDEPINSKFSTAQFFYSNKTATGSYNTFGFMFSGAHKIIDQHTEGKTKRNLSVGIQFGVFNRSIHPVNFTHDSQYSPDAPSGDGFDKSLPSGETYDSRESYYNFNVNFGVYYRVTSQNKKVSGFGGFSIYNIGQPNESYFGSYSSLPLRFNLHGGVYWVINEQIKIMPQLLYMNQAKASELNLNVLLLSKMEGTLYEPIYGLGFRNKDAIFFQVGLRYKGLTFRVSYDALTNYTKVYKHRGLEFSIVNTLEKIKRKSQKTEN